MGKTKIKEVTAAETDPDRSVVDDSAETPGLAKQEKPAPKPAQKPKAGHKNRSQKYLAKVGLVEKNKFYPLEEAVELVKQASYSKFDGSLEAHINTGAKNLRGLVSLPFAAGEKLTILAFGTTSGSELAKKLESEGAILGGEQKIADIQKGQIDFDVVVTNPDWMPKLAKVASVLGPRGLMPNPKNGTITDNLLKTVTELQSGKVEYKTEKSGQVIHLSVGKVSQPATEICQNLRALLSAVGRSKVKKITLSPTMGPGVKVNLSSI